MMALALLLSMHTAQVDARTPAWSQADVGRHLQVWGGSNLEVL